MNTPCTGHAAESERDEWMAECERLLTSAMNSMFLWGKATVECDAKGSLYAHCEASGARAALLDHIRRGVPAPAEVPMPKPDTSDIAGYTPHALRTYGDAREAAGYARAMAQKGGE